MTDAAAVLPYRAMAYNNAWANHRLLAACAAGLSHDEFTAPQTGFFPSLRATLNHILVIDWFYVDAMEGGTLGPAAWGFADGRPGKAGASVGTASRSLRQTLFEARKERAPEWRATPNGPGTFASPA